jgi:hypothetical protein
MSATERFARACVRWFALCFFARENKAQIANCNHTQPKGTPFMYSAKYERKDNAEAWCF